MFNPKVLLSGFIIGILSAFLDWFFTEVLFSRDKTFLNVTGKTERGKSSFFSTVISFYYGLAVAGFYANVNLIYPSVPPGHLHILSAIGVGMLCWMVFTVPLIASNGLSSNWNAKGWIGLCLHSASKVIAAATVFTFMM